MSFIASVRRGSRRRRAALSTVTLAALLAPATAAMGGVVSGSAPVGAAEGSSPDGARDGAVWVVNREAGEVAIFDADTGELLARQPTGGGAHDVTISDGAHRVYVTNEGGDTVSIVSTGQLDATTVDLGPKPHHVEVSRDGRTIAVGLFGTNAVALIDADTGATETYASSSDPAAAAHGIYLLDHTLYVAHETGDLVTAVDTATGDIIFSIDGISEPSEVLPDASGEILYVSARGEGVVKVIDLNAQRVVGEVEVGEEPEGLLLTDDGGTLIVTIRGSPARVAFVDTGTLAVTDVVDLAGADTSGDLAAISDDGRFVYATFDRGETGTGGIAVVDVESRALMDTWAYPGVGRVHGIAYTSEAPRVP